MIECIVIVSSDFAKGDRGVLLPTEIRERIVRCRDCERALDGATCGGIWCMEHRRQTEPDGFCAWGRSAGVDD